MNQVGSQKTSRLAFFNGAMWVFLVASIRALGPTASVMLRHQDVLDRMFHNLATPDDTPEMAAKWQADRMERITQFQHLADLFAISFAIGLLISICMMMANTSRKQGIVGFVAAIAIVVAGIILSQNGMYQ